MKADSLRIAEVFLGGGDIHFVLPHFQREYTWDKVNWQTLLSDALALHDELGEGWTVDEESDGTSSSARELEHFLGSLVVVADGMRRGNISAFKLVDGQQRLTSVSLMLCALARLVEGSAPALARDARKYLVNRDKEGDLLFKLLPTAKYGDRAAYAALLRGEPAPSGSESRIPQAYEFFLTELSPRLSSGAVEAERFLHVLAHCFQVVYINLNRDESPYRIFESLNGKGKPLTQADLVRNYIAMRLPSQGQQKVFDDHWARVESALQERRQVGRSRLGELTAFLRHYLALRSGVLCSEEHVYARFRDRAEREFQADDAFAQEIATLARFAALYERLLRPEREASLKVRERLERLSVLEVSTAFPFLLTAFDARDSGELTEADLLALLGVLENYLVRRHLAGEPTNFLNKLFPTLWGQTDKTDPITSLKALLSARGYPSDARVKAAIQTRSFYDKSELTRGRTKLLLESINRHLSSGTGGYTVLGGAATIEHVLPQSPGPDWLDELGGDDPEAIHRELVHTLGNLTLVTQDWNSSLSNAPFAIKRTRLAAHALKLNSEYFGRDGMTTWDTDAIRARGAHLADQVLAIWPALGDSAAAGAVKTAVPSASFHQEVADRVGQHLRLSLVKHAAGQATFATVDDATRVIVAVSKRYDRGSAPLYWFAFHPSQRSWLETVPNAYVAFGCGSAEKVVLFSLADLLPYVANMGTTTKDGRFYNHVQIHEGGRGALLLAQPVVGPGAKTDITAFLLKNGGGAK